MHLGIIALLLACLLLAACAPDRFQPHDIVIIVLDTTRADHLGVYGSPRVVSPNIDRFSSDAEVYENAWSPSSWTLPAHASLLTGKYPTSHGAYNRAGAGVDPADEKPRLSESATTLAELLRARGYQTAAYAGAGWLAPEFGLLQGYSIQDAENYRSIGAEALTDRAIAWLDRVPADRPFHLLINYFDAHGPYQPPPEFDVFSTERTPALGPPPLNDIKTLPAKELMQRFATDMAAAINRYDGEILYMDHHVGRLIDKLRALGRYENALIVIVADHGEAFLEHGAVGHGAWLYEPLIRVPFIVHRPGGRNRGSRMTTAVSLVDVLAIVATETGLPLPEGLDALPVGSRRLVLAEETAGWIFRAPSPNGQKSQLDRDLRVAVRWPFKLILNVPGGKELYRLDRDPAELENLADGEAEVRLEKDLEAAFAALAPPPPSHEPPRPMSPESQKRLRALGYLE